MTEPKVIKTENYTTKSQRFNELLQEGIEWIQQFSGSQWTDYNFHDPGITFLEQICFAITDLGYKSNFPIEDILFIGQDEFDLEAKNLLFPPHKIFPSSPTTINDYRKLIIDRVDSIQNVWIYPQTNNVFSISGLFSVKIQLSENQDKKIADKTLNQVDSLLMKYRSLCTDFNPAELLKKDEITFECDIILDSFAVGENVLAQVYKNIEESISSKPKFFDYDELLETGHRTEDLFIGPLTEKGYLKDLDFSEKTSEIYISEIKEIMYDVEGVLSVEKLVFFKNGIKIFDDYIPFETDSYPSLSINDTKFLEDGVDGVRFFRNESFYKIDFVLFKQIYDSLNIESKQTHRQKFQSELTSFKGRFKKDQFEKYYSIMRELPSIYGLREDELPINSTNLRKSQANQLRSYLLLFDQLMANHNSQVSNMRNLFSVDVKPNKTLFGRAPLDVPNLEIIVGKDLKQYNESLEKSIETKNDFFRRKNRLIDHMLSRFGEIFNTSTIGKIKKLQYEDLSEEEVQEYTLESKINYGKNLIDLGYNRNRSFDYTSKNESRENLSGIENRLRLKLSIKDKTSKSVLEFLTEESKLEEINDSWRKKTITIEEGPTLEVLSLSIESYKDKQVHFYLSNNQSLRKLFVAGLKSKNFNTIKTKESYLVIYKSPNDMLPAVIYKSESEVDCKQKVQRIIQKIQVYNQKSENFFMVENILLRPVSNDDFTLFVLDKNKKRYLQSFYNSDLDYFQDLSKDFKILGKDKKNYNVVKKNNDQKFEIIIYDLLSNPIFKSYKVFSKEISAKSEIPIMIEFFENIIKNEEVEKYNEIEKANNLSNKFPDNFNYSNHVNFIFPDWPFRFQNKEFKNYIINVIDEYIPAHLSFDLFFIDINQMTQFEQSYFKWKSSKLFMQFDHIDSKSLEIIQLLMHYKKDGDK